jgi:hypothetical protein
MKPSILHVRVLALGVLALLRFVRWSRVMLQRRSVSSLPALNNRARG